MRGVIAACDFNHKWKSGEKHTLESSTPDNNSGSLCNRLSVVQRDDSRKDYVQAFFREEGGSCPRINFKR